MEATRQLYKQMEQHHWETIKGIFGFGSSLGAVVIAQVTELKDKLSTVAALIGVLIGLATLINMLFIIRKNKAEASLAELRHYNRMHHREESSQNLPKLP